MITHIPRIASRKRPSNIERMRRCMVVEGEKSPDCRMVQLNTTIEATCSMLKKAALWPRLVASFSLKGFKLTGKLFLECDNHLGSMEEWQADSASHHVAACRPLPVLQPCSMIRPVRTGRSAGICQRLFIEGRQKNRQELDLRFRMLGSLHKAPIIGSSCPHHVIALSPLSRERRQLHTMYQPVG